MELITSPVLTILSLVNSVEGAGAIGRVREFCCNRSRNSAISALRSSSRLACWHNTVSFCAQAARHGFSGSTGHRRWKFVTQKFRDMAKFFKLMFCPQLDAEKYTTRITI